MVEVSKKCKTCGQVRPEEEFIRFIRRELKGYNNSSECRICHNKRVRRNHINKKYKMSVARYDALCRSDNSRCEICGAKPYCQSKQEQCQLVIDHNHKSGKVRGVLCIQCNTTLHLIEDRELFNSASAYLSTHKTISQKDLLDI